MTLHKLTAGDGYTYLTRQVAAHDATERGYDSLGDYYSEKGETPGEWVGNGCARMPHFLGGRVTEAQMIALFGEGRHPDAERIEAEMRAAGHGTPAILAATRLGTPFKRNDDQVPEFRRRCAEAFEDHNAREGVPRDWPVPAERRAAIRTEIARSMFAAEYDRDPADARELSGYLAHASRQATTSVAGYDLTFSPVKSVSALWALAPPEVAEQIEAAHLAAVLDALGWLEHNAAFTRTGRDSAQQIEVAGLIGAAFTHRDSRAGDPDLHTHVAISNKVQSTRDGRWLALDGRPLYKMAVAASERYNTRLEIHLTERLGLRFAERTGDDPAKRPVREIVGVADRLLSTWSRRRTAIDERRAVLSADFQANHGRTPTTIEALALAQQANLETRQGKHAPRSRAEQRAAWKAEAIAALGDEHELSEMLATALGAGRRPFRVLTRRQIGEAANRVLATVQHGRSTWQECHLRAEAERFARAAGIRARRIDETVDAIVATALAPSRSIRLAAPDRVEDPPELRRSDGTSVYECAGTVLYTSAEILAAEARLVAMAGAGGGRELTGDAVEVALIESTANGVDLNPGQAQLVRELACSGARVQLALAPAGTGKTAAMRVLCRAWQSPDGASPRGGHVVGLAPSAAAAAVLRDEIGAHTDTIAKLTHTLDTAPEDPPNWVAAIGPGSLVIVDEAGMAGTTDLARVADYVTSRGGVVRLIGDDQQLASVAAGGVLRDIAATAGAVHLSQVVRFADPAEGAASLALRAGDPAAIGFYLDHGRVHVGDLSTVADAAYRAWAADRAAGRDAVMLAPTRELVAALNARARADRVGATGQTGREVRLADGSAASAGDVVITRSNDRRLPIARTDFVKNGDRWTVESIRDDGAVRVRHHGTGRHIVLPASYVAAHVSLGYAATVHAAQGITADTSHLVAEGEETRQLIYVALTRGRTANHIYLATGSDGDPHSVITRDALLPPTAADLLTRVISRDGAQASATTHRRELADPVPRMRDAAIRYHDALLTAAESRLGADGAAALARAAKHALPGLTAAESWPTLRAHLALVAASGDDVDQALHAAISSRPLGDARDLAAVLDWRLDPSRRRGDPSGPLSWLPGIPDAIATDHRWGAYLGERFALVADLARHVATATETWTPATAPAWAVGILDRDPRLVADLAVWRAALAVPDTEPHPTGPPRHLAAEARAQRILDDRVQQIRGDTAAATGRLRNLVDDIDPRIGTDPYWPQLAERLTAARRAGIDIADLIAAVSADAPLPDEYPAAALWWRICRHLAPATLAADRQIANTLRPHWTPALIGIVGESAARRIVDDPAWPALVAAVTDAADVGWEPKQLLATAYGLLESGHPDDGSLREDELATALIWRVGMLTDPPAATMSHPDSDPPADLILQVPADLDLLPNAVDAAGGVDKDWATGRTPHDEPPVVWVATDPDSGVETDAIYVYPSSGGVLRARLVELNQQAVEFYIYQYPRSWAAAYLADRIGAGPLVEAEARFTPGYAPAEWTALVDHLHRRGATDTELVAAGLASRARNGRLIDRFRDRLVLPIWHDDEIHGFIARRNPTLGDDAGPKYLNTPETDLFIKGAQLYGLHETRDLLAAGATPVLVEGPLDAWAVTLAGDGRLAGVAPLGTAFTDRQADRLRPWIGSGKPGVLVATDNDPAGRRAAERAYWQLAARGDAPRLLMLPDGLDPADVLRRHGPDALRSSADIASSLAKRLVNQRLDRYAGRLDTVEGTVFAARAAAQVIGALPPDHWVDLIQHAQVCLPGAPPGLMHLEVIDAGQAWTTDPFAHADEQLRAARSADLPAAQRWAELGRRIDPRLTTGHDWIPLAEALDRAQQAGYDVDQRLPMLAATAPLPYRDAARELHTRLASDCPAAAMVATHANPDARSANGARDTTTSRCAACPQDPFPTRSRPARPSRGDPSRIKAPSPPRR